MANEVEEYTLRANDVTQSKTSRKAAAELAIMAEQDLVVASTNDRNWRGIAIAILVISSVLALIVTSVVLLTPPDEGPRVKGNRFNLEQIFNDPKYQPLRSNGSWISDHEWVFWDHYGGISLLDARTQDIKRLVSNKTVSEYNPASFSVSANQKFALLTHDVKKLYRLSFTAKYSIVDIESGSTSPLSLGLGNRHHEKESHSFYQLVKWSPVSNSLIIVHDGDIYYKENATDETSIRLTDTGESGILSNGVPDWLYEEEILGSNTALWFSEDSHRLLYLTFNDSLVGEHYIIQYGNPDEPHQYPRVRALRYPKPGTNNPTVTASVVDLRRGRNHIKIHFQPPERITNKDFYITAAGWVKSTDVGIIWTSRSYNQSIITICSTTNGICQEEYEISSKKWVDNIPFPIFSNHLSSKNFITIAPIRDGENGFFDHLVLVDTLYKRTHPITHGSFDVIKINAWDEEKRFVYFTATPSSHPNERRLFRVKVEQPYSDHSAECISCIPEEINENERIPMNQTISEKPKIEPRKKQSDSSKNQQQQYFQQQPQSKSSILGNMGRILSKDRTTLRSNKSCSYVTDVKFSRKNKFYILECSGPEIPYETLYSAENSRKPLRVIQNNDALLEACKEMAFPQIRIFSVKLSSGHYAQVRLLLPPGLREDEITQYPLMVNVYGGPGTQLALDRWTIDFTTYLAATKDFIVAQIDGAGSGGRGWTYQHKVYYNLGHMEAEDQMEVARHLKESLPYVDENKVGIFGWSYGAYLTALIMTNKDKTNLFRCGASIAPVTKWDLYDSAYTERYMGTPNVTDNFKGYINSDITRNIENFEKKMFYLIHGTGDDNVHLQHSMLLAKALVKKKVLFRQQIYPDEEHNLNGARIHVHRSLEVFFDDCYIKQMPTEVLPGLRSGKFAAFDQI